MRLPLQIPAFVLFIFIFLLGNDVAYGQLQFVENKGQWHPFIEYRSDVQNGAVFLHSNGFSVLQYDAGGLDRMAALMHGHETAENKLPEINGGKFSLRSHQYQVKFSGASNTVTAFPEKPFPTYNNYFLGDDPKKWQSDCKLYRAITYRNVYPNIDVRYYSDAGSLKYDFIVRPGGNPDDILMEFDGADDLYVKNRELIIQTSVGTVKELYPYTYQVLEGVRKELDCRYVVKGQTVRFKINGYVPGQTLVIDPSLRFSTFTGSAVDNWGYTATPGSDGSLFAGGIAFGAGYRTTNGAYNQNFNGGVDEDGNGPYDIAITKFSSNGTVRVYGTYLGGNANEQPHSMMCDAQGNLVVGGRSNSGNFPKLIPQIGNGGGYDIVITKFNATGTALIGSVKIGGTSDDGVNIKPKYMPVNPPLQNDGAFETRRNYGDDARSEVILDGNNDIYMASCTQSTDFPRTNTGIQTAYGGGRQDGVILKFNANLSTMNFATFFGGSGSDACFVLSINPINGRIYVGGSTTSNNLPGDKTGAVTTSFQGGITDGFVTIINPDGSGIIKTTYVGTGGNDMLYGVQFDKFGFPYIMGATTGNFTVINATFSQAGGKQFIGKLQPDLSAYAYFTVFGTGASIPNLSPTAFLVDRCQNVYVSGWGGKFNNGRGYPCAGTTGLTVTSDAIQSTTDGDDFYFFVLERNATKQLFGSFFGQRGGFDDHVDGGTSRFDANGIIYQAICANCGNTSGIIFPTTPGVVASTNGSSNCNEAAVKIEMNFGGIGASVKATIAGVVDTVGCVPMDVKFTDTLAKGKKYIWNFGDGSPEVTTFAPNNSTSHIYTQVGTYKLRLVSIDSSTCNIADTAYVTVRVGNNTIFPNFIPAKVGGCQSLTYQFTNTTTAVLPNFSASGFLWDFGDGSPKVRAGYTAVSHTYASPGTYIVKLIADDTVFCNAPDSVMKTIRLATNVKAQFTTPAIGCVPYNAVFTNTSLGGTDFLWDFGDGSPSSTDPNPVHFYANTGTYIVKMIAYDTATCNKKDSVTFTINVLSIPQAAFDFSPVPPLENTITNFNNLSVGAVSYIWDFGDGESSTLTNPSHLFNATGTYSVCLVAINAAGCRDTVCRDVSAIVLPLLDVPNAFTPGNASAGVHGGANNAIIKVEGFGVAKMQWNIYNRWGQLVFTSTSIRQGWDGTFKGALQPMDVYTYTLEAVFTDGKSIRKTGDITLIR